MITIITMTWKEMLRKRVMMLSLIMTVIFLVAFWFIAKAISHEDPMMDADNISSLIQRVEQGAVILSLGIFFGSFVISFLCIFSSVGVVAGEAEQGVLQAMIPRPIARWKWFLGRWLGYVSLGIAYACLLFSSILAVTRSHAAVPSDLISILQSFALFALVVPVLISVTMVGSCFFSALGNGVFMVMLYGAGLLGGMIEKMLGAGLFSAKESSHTLQTISGLISIIMPADTLQRRMMADLFSLRELQEWTNLNRILGPFAINQIPSNTFLVYTVCYMLAALVMGIVLFQRKDL